MREMYVIYSHEIDEISTTIHLSFRTAHATATTVVSVPVSALASGKFYIVFCSRWIIKQDKGG